MHLRLLSLHCYIHWQNHIDYEGEHCFLPQNISDRNKFDWLRLIKAQLIEMDLIQPLNDEETRLTLKGENFVSFEEYYKKVRKKEREDKIKSWPERYWWVIMVVSLIFSPIIVELIRVKFLTSPILSQPATQASTDTSLSHKTDSSYTDILLKTK